MTTLGFWLVVVLGARSAAAWIPVPPASSPVLGMRIPIRPLARPVWATPGKDGAQSDKPIRVERLSKGGRDFIVEYFRDGSQSFRALDSLDEFVAGENAQDDQEVDFFSPRGDLASGGLGKPEQPEPFGRGALERPARPSKKGGDFVPLGGDKGRKKRFGLPEDAQVQKARKWAPRGAPQGVTPRGAEPIPRYPAGGAFDLGPSQEARSARQREDRQVEQLLRVFGSDKAMLFGSVALMLGSLAFGYAWRSGALERDSPSAAMARSEEATEYMLKNGGLPTQEELEDVDVTVTFEDE